MSMDAEELGTSMLGAVRSVVGDRWPEIQQLAEDELEDLARVLVRIELRQSTGAISEAEARALMRIHRNTVETVLAGIQGMTLVMAEMAVNAAMDVVRVAVNSSVGFDLV